MRSCQLILFILFVFIRFVNAGQVLIQEEEAGFCAVDGQIMTSVTGYTGNGYADTDFGIGKSISWSVNAATSGTYYLQWRYGNGGDLVDRAARVLINGAVVEENLSFPHTGSWTNWTISDSFEVYLKTGDNQIRIEATVTQGLGNYDYLIAHGENLSPGVCVTSYVLEVDQNNPSWGMVSYEPVQEYYTARTQVTLTAKANPGYFFQSWSGDKPSADSIFIFTISKNVHATAIFLPVGTAMHPDAMGYATVQDDKGTPYMVIGGTLGDSVHATSASELETYLNSDEPLTITFSEMFTGTQEISFKSNKTLLGIGDNAHLSGIGLNVNGVTNVIIKNLKVSKVSPKDAIEITGAAKNIWIDHCEFYSDRDHGSEFYDGLLDIKNESSFITVSWSKFHDHFKTILISSNDQSPQDSITRVTFHHNYFYNCSSRLPSIRFGKAHIFNNYYKNNDSGINSRMGACVRVEKNYFKNTSSAITMEFSLEPGSVQLIDNIFVLSSYLSEPSCAMVIPYTYDHILNEPEELPMLIAGEATAIDEVTSLPLKYEFTCYPNPFNPEVTIRFTLPKTAHVIIDIYNVLGQQINRLVEKKYKPGQYTISWNAYDQPSGVYYCRIKLENYSNIKKMVLIR